jgi:predicted metalloprotease with PDZ domain
MGGPAQSRQPQPPPDTYQGPPGQYDDQNQAQQDQTPAQTQSQNQNQNDEDAVVEEFEWASGGSHLGVVVEGMTKDLRGYFGAPADRGVLVAHVEQGSAAQQAGVRVGDILLRVGNHRITSADDVISAISASQSTNQNNPGNWVKLDVLRRGQRVHLQAMLESENQNQNQPSTPQNSML